MAPGSEMPVRITTRDAVISILDAKQQYSLIAE